MTAELASPEALGGLLGGLSPGFVLILGALAIPVLPERVRGPYMLALPLIAMAQLFSLEHGVGGAITLFDIELTTLRLDRLSFIFAVMFLIATLLSMIYQMHVKGWLEHTAGLIYAGSAVGAVFAGDLVTLFLFWEGTAVASVFLIWATGTPAALAAGQRYLFVQIGSGVLLLAGAMVHYGQTGSLAFESFDVESTAGLLILLSFGIKCAFPLLHNWLQDAYPQGTVTGTVMLSAFTTKLAIYALARGFSGTEVLITIGIVMAVFPIVFALVENDLRRVLAYSLNSQLGFMVVGVGIGSELAVAGAAAHAFCSVFYKGLLYMAMGAVLHRTGTAKASDLGGLHRSMPMTSGFCLVGAAAISAFPLFSGFVSKSLIISAAMKEGYLLTWIALLTASVGAFLHSGIKVPYYAFFGRDSGLRPDEAPRNMLVAMALTAALCIAIGLLPGPFYAMLPYDVSYHVYTLAHIVTQLQLLALTGLAFVLARRFGLFPEPERAITLDTDWLWRKPVAALLRLLAAAWESAYAVLADKGVGEVRRFIAGLYRTHGPESALASSRPSGYMALWMTLLLGVFMLFAFI